MARTVLFSWLTRQLKIAYRSLETESLNTSESPLISTGANTLINRRDFLKGMLVGGAALGVAVSPTLRAMAALPALQSPLAPVDEATPVLIVGGGLAGLTTAYYLSKQAIPCVVYEASSRLGGRIFTKDDFNRDGMFVELGGELVDTGHVELLRLCEELSVPVEPFASFDEGVEPAIFFSEGRVRQADEIAEAFQPLARRLAYDLKRCFPGGEVDIPTYQTPYQSAAFDRLSLEQYLNVQTNVAPWLIKLIKTAYTGEYGRDPSKQSALNLLLLIGLPEASVPGEKPPLNLYGESDEAFRIQGGGTRLIEALTRELGRRNVPVYMRHALSHIEFAEEQETITLTFRTEETQNGTSPSVIRQTTGGPVVLAVPFSVLRHVSGVRELPLSPRKKQCITQWGYGTNSKMMMGFKSRFWRERPANGAVAPIPPNTGETYTDLPSQCFWETSRLQAGQSGILTNFLGGEAGRTMQAAQQEQALQDLGSLYPQAASQLDGNRALMNWSLQPWAQGSYTCPAPGQYTTLMGAAGEPEIGGRLVFAGEHCSVPWAGYMNGAAHSALLAVEHIFKSRKALGAMRQNALAVLR